MPAAAGIGMVLWFALRPAAPPRLLVGVDDDTLEWTSHPLAIVGWQRSLGVEAVRVSVRWRREARPSRRRLDELARAEQAARRIRVVLAVFGFARDTPRTPGLRERFCGYAAAVLARVPHASDERRS